MKRFSAISVLLMAIVFFACAGGTSTKKTPRHLTAGMKALTEGIAKYDKGCYHRALEYFF